METRKQGKASGRTKERRSLDGIVSRFGGYDHGCGAMGYTNHLWDKRGRCKRCRQTRKMVADAKAANVQAQGRPV